MLPTLNDVKEIEDDEKIFGESYDSEENDQASNDHVSEINIQQNESEESGSENGEPEGRPNKKIGDMQSDHMSGDLFASRQLRYDEKEDFRKTYEQYIDHQPAQQLPPSHVYEIIMKSFYDGRNKIRWP